MNTKSHLQATATARPDPELKGAVPTFVIIGAMKAGTSSLHSYLAAHPDFSMSLDKEPDYFLEKKNWSRGIDWYRSLFDPAKPHRGEGSVNYTKFPAFPDAPEKMAQVIPDARLVFLARDPVDRIRSHHAHQVSAMEAPLHLQLPRDRKILDHYIACSKYALQLRRFLEFFPQESLHVACTSELREQTVKAVREVISFLGADPDRLPDGVCDRIYHESGAKIFPTAFGALVSKLPQGKRVVRSRKIGPLSSILSTPARKIKFDADILSYIKASLAEDMADFQKIAGRDFAFRLT